MPFKVVCPICDTSRNVADGLAGRDIRCKNCGMAFVADAPSTRAVAPNEPAPALDLPSPFGKFRPIRKLGQGGMGAVYLAHDNELDRLVALKVPLADQAEKPEILKRFRREAIAAASFHHPNFCPVYEAGKVGDRPYLAMAYIEGQTTASLVNPDRPMDPLQAANLVRNVALAMAEAHDKGIIHRDLKPSNLMLDAKNGEPIIMDFGLVRRQGAGDESLTTPDVPLGTIAYMSPEAARGSKGGIGPATDIYSLGVILYELMTGRRPFEGKALAVLSAILTEEPPPASSHRPGLDPRLVEICTTAMSKTIAGRYGSMRAFAKALADVLGPEKERDDKPPIDRSDGSPPAWRKRAVAIMGGLAALVLGIVVYVATDKGTLKIEGFDPGMMVRVDGEKVTIEKAGDPTITVRTGTRRLLITRGGVEVEAPEKFEVKRGEVVVVRITSKPDPKPPVPDLAEVARQKDEADRIAEAAKTKQKEKDAADAKSKADAESAKTAAMPAADSAKPKPADPPAPAVAPKELTSREAPGLTLKRIEAGDFIRGSDDGDADEKPARKVTITKPFYMGVHEVTQGQWKAVMGDKVKPFFTGPATLPMEQVSWSEAVEFCNALSVKEGLEPYYAITFWAIKGEEVSIKWGIGYRLPTEAEWEYACRAGSTGKYTFGDDESKLGEYAWFDGNSKVGGPSAPHPVGGKEKNAFGLYDMHGNVWEWCWDWHDDKYYYDKASYLDPFGPYFDPFGPGTGISRVLRGGSYCYGPTYLRCANRLRDRPAIRNRNYRFRLARSYP